MNEAEKITPIREWWAKYWPERKELLEPWMEPYFDKYAKCAIREFSRAIAEKIRAEKPTVSGVATETASETFEAAARILEQEAGERNNG